MTRKLRVGVIGAGIAQAHLEGYNDNKDLFEVPVLTSLDEERGRQAVAKHGVGEFTTDLDSLFTRDDIDVIDICTPPVPHFELCKRAIEAGKHVICEKPLFGSVAEVDAMAEILAKSDRKFMPIFQYRYGSGLQKMKMLVDKGLTGKPYLSTIETHWWRGPEYYDVEWRGKWKSELGGSFLGHAIHIHDMLCYIQGPVAAVSAHGATLMHKIEVEDTMVASVTMQNGSLAALSVTLGSHKELSRLRFCFSDMTAESVHAPYTFGEDPWTFTSRDPAHQARIDAALAEYVDKDVSYPRQFQLFHEAVMTGGEVPVTLEEARMTIELVTAAYHSQRTGQVSKLPVTPDHPYYNSWLP
jgi:predicted dehydrogenase